MTIVGWAILLFLLGLIFLILEFFIPSGGALGALCGLSFVVAIAIGFLAGRWFGTAILLAVCLIVPLALTAAIRWWPDTPIGRLMLVQRPASPAEVLPETVAYRGLQELIGQRGIAKGLMVPSGSVTIAGQTYDAVSEGMPIESHEPIIVIGVSTQRLIVRPDTTIQAELAAHQPTAAEEPLVPDIPDPFAEG